jgi:kynureninase
VNLSQRAQALDRNDPLGEVRQRFAVPDGLCYLDGNSLGALAKAVREAVQTTVNTEWGEGLIGSWNDCDWISLPLRVGERIGRLIGAAEGQTLCADNLSTNLFKLLYSALALNTERRVILTERGNFPTDNYIAEGLAAMLGPDRCVVRYFDPEGFDQVDLSDVAVVSITHVNFRTGAMWDMAEITRRVQSAGAFMLWDLAHSAGVTELELDACGVDMAVGCTYKYLNGGPGGPGFLYLNRRHQAVAATAIQGWMGHANLFAFAPDYQPALGIERFLTGTQGVLGMRAVEAALAVYDDLTPAQVREKSVALTQFFMEAVAAMPQASALPCLTPAEPEQRGSQVCLTHPEGYAVAQALISAGVVVDFREPDIIRFGFAPLYLSFAEVLGAAEVLEDILRTEVWREPRFMARKTVT